MGEAALGQVFFDGNTMSADLDLGSRSKGTRRSIGCTGMGCAICCLRVGYEGGCGGGGHGVERSTEGGGTVDGERPPALRAGEDILAGSHGGHDIGIFRITEHAQWACGRVCDVCWRGHQVACCSCLRRYERLGSRAGLGQGHQGHLQCKPLSTTTNTLLVPSTLVTSSHRLLVDIFEKNTTPCSLHAGKYRGLSLRRCDHFLYLCNLLSFLHSRLLASDTGIPGETPRKHFLPGTQMQPARFHKYTEGNQLYMRTSLK